jgi:hypothetical protein
MIDNDAARQPGGRPPPMTDDEWQAHVTRQAAKAIGEWLEARGRLHQPIRVLALWELEAIAQAAISSFIVLGCSRIKDEPGEHPDLTRFLLA